MTVLVFGICFIVISSEQVFSADSNIVPAMVPEASGAQEDHYYSLREASHQHILPKWRQQRTENAKQANAEDGATGIKPSEAKAQIWAGPPADTEEFQPRSGDLRIQNLTRIQQDHQNVEGKDVVSYICSTVLHTCNTISTLHT